MTTCTEAHIPTLVQIQAVPVQKEEVYAQTQKNGTDKYGYWKKNSRKRKPWGKACKNATLTYKDLIFFSFLAEDKWDKDTSNKWQLTGDRQQAEHPCLLSAWAGKKRPCKWENTSSLTGSAGKLPGQIPDQENGHLKHNIWFKSVGPNVFQSFKWFHFRRVT